MLQRKRCWNTDTRYVETAAQMDLDKVCANTRARQTAQPNIHCHADPRSADDVVLRSSEWIEILDLARGRVSE